MKNVNFMTVFKISWDPGNSQDSENIFPVSRVFLIPGKLDVLLFSIHAHDFFQTNFKRLGGGVPLVRICSNLEFSLVAGHFFISRVRGFGLP